MTRMSPRSIHITQLQDTIRAMEYRLETATPGAFQRLVGDLAGKYLERDVLTEQAPFIPVNR